MAAPIPSTSSSAPVPSALRGTIGLILVRLVVPLWVLAGAIFKLWERNPKLLPEPVRDATVRVAGWLGVPGDNLGAFLDSSLRFLIGTELVLVLIMLLVPKLARAAAIFTLSVFVVVLIGVLWKGGDNCGCFGSGGPPPWAMLLIDSVLLLGVILCKPAKRPSTGALFAAAAVGGLAAFGLAFGVPNKSMSSSPAPIGPSEAVKGGASDAGPTDVAASGTAQAPASSAWPPPPAPKTTYFFRSLDEWVGKPLRDIDIAQVINRPLPDGIDQGPWHVVFYRGDCPHCHELLEDHMVSRAARTIAVKVPEETAGAELPLPNAPFRLHTLPAGPNYVFTTPLLLAVVDGRVAAVCGDSTDEAAVKATLAAADGASAAPPQAPASPPPATPTSPAQAPPPSVVPATAPAAGGWPAAPAPETTYFPQWPDWSGKRLDAQPLSRQIVPVGSSAGFDLGRLNAGRWHILFYRADCDHCHELMEIYLQGQLEKQVVAIRVPDTDPANDLDMPLTQSVMCSLPEGPNYVFSTPILLTVVDGKIVGLATDSENEEEVKACLDAGLSVGTGG